jgi:antitoxin MazE
MLVMIRRLVNAQGLIIPTAWLDRLGVEDHIEMTIEKDSIVLRKPVGAVRAGWADASKEIGRLGDDQLVLGDFSTEADGSWTW